MNNFLNEKSIKNSLQKHHADGYYAGTYQGDQGFFVVLDVDQPSVEHIAKKLKDIEEDLKKDTGKKDIFVTINTQTTSQKKQSAPINTQHIGHIISVGAGKGGVGKSSMAIQLALSFRKHHLKVGLLDADIYGPSLSLLLNLDRKPEINEKKQMIPATVNGIKCMSMGMLLEKEQPAMWRGPMIQGAITQLIKDVDWGPLDILIIDLPPGTGDAQIGICQQIKLDGAIIVTTPQELSWVEAIKASALFKKFSVPILGFIENMSVYTCSSCQHTAPLFHHEPHLLTRHVLGKVPFYPTLQEPLAQQPPMIENLFFSISQNIWKAFEKNSLNFNENDAAKSVAGT